MQLGACDRYQFTHATLEAYYFCLFFFLRFFMSVSMHTFFHPPMQCNGGSCMWRLTCICIALLRSDKKNEHDRHRHAWRQHRHQAPSDRYNAITSLYIESPLSRTSVWRCMLSQGHRHPSTACPRPAELSPEPWPFLLHRFPFCKPSLASLHVL